MKMHHYHCGRLLRLWEIKCPYCHRSAMGWQHVLCLAALAMTFIVFLLKPF
jgi:hypothetical protein